MDIQASPETYADAILTDPKLINVLLFVSLPSFLLKLTATGTTHAAGNTSMEAST